MLSSLILAIILSNSCSQTTTCRFWGHKGLKFEYDRSSYVMPESGVIELPVEDDDLCTTKPESKILYIAGNSRNQYGTITRVFLP